MNVGQCANTLLMTWILRLSFYTEAASFLLKARVISRPRTFASLSKDTFRLMLAGPAVAEGAVRTVNEVVLLPRGTAFRLPSKRLAGRP